MAKMTNLERARQFMPFVSVYAGMLNSELITVCSPSLVETMAEGWDPVGRMSCGPVSPGVVGVSFSGVAGSVTSGSGVGACSGSGVSVTGAQPKAAKSRERVNKSNTAICNVRFIEDLLYLSWLIPTENRWQASHKSRPAVHRSPPVDVRGRAFRGSFRR